MKSVLPPCPTPWLALGVRDLGMTSFSSYKEPGRVSQGLWGLTGPQAPDFSLPLVPCPMSMKGRLLHRGLYLSIQVGFRMRVGICYSHECLNKC